MTDPSGKKTASDASPSALDAGTSRALQHLGVIALTLVGAIGATYLVPSFARFRPWIPGERLPFTGLDAHANDAPASVGAGSGYRSGTAMDSEALADELGDEVAAALQAPEPVAPASETVAPATHDAGLDAAPRVTIGADEYGTVRVPIVDRDFRGLAPFFESLRRTALREEGAITRAAHYGDSTIATDHVTHTVRRRLQSRFGDAGHGFILIARGYMPYRHQDVAHVASSAWRIREVTRAAARDGRYGFGGVLAAGRAGAVATFGPHDDEDVATGRAVARYELWFRRQPRGGDLRVSIDGAEPEVLSTASLEGGEGGGEGARDEVVAWEVPDGMHELELRYAGGGKTSLYGVVMEREGPGVVYDSLGLVGARASRMLNFDREHLLSQLERRGTDLLILGFGGNDASDLTTEERYYEQFREVLAHVREEGERGAERGCLVFAPLDQAERNDRGVVRTMPMVPKIVSAQRRAADEAGCAFYDTWEAMGGDGAMRRWLRSRPPLASADYRHATPEGYRVIGDLFYRALLQAFARYLEAYPEPPIAETETEDRQ